jgi:TolB-like protein/DNA-binding winged helix-turn-helix (wHTH) protein
MDSNAATATAFMLHEVRVEPGTLQIERQGQLIAVEPKAMAVLCYLVDNRHRVVSNDELMTALWDGVIVTPNAITRIIAQLRKALDDDAKQPRFIKTAVRGGYRVIAPVRLHGPTTPPRWRLPALLLAASVALTGAYLLWPRAVPVSNPGVAVLPFANLTGQDELTYVSDGVSEEIIHSLTQVPSLNVASRTASFRFRDPQTALQSIADELGVGFVVEGSVRRSAGRIRITAQLIDAGSGFHLYSKTADYGASDLFAAQSSISRDLRAALQATLSLESVEPAAEERAPDSRAYELFLRARYIWHRRGNEPLGGAIELLSEAVEIDPEFARGWAALSSAYLSYPAYSAEGYKTWHLARPAAERALALDAALAEPYAALATFDQTANEWIAAETKFLRAIELDPTSATVNYWYAQHLAKVGRLGDGLQYLKRTLQLDPTYLPPQTDFAFAAMSFGDYGWAADQLERIRALDFESVPNWGAQLIASILIEDFAGAHRLVTVDLPPRLQAERAGISDVMIRFITAVESGTVPADLASDLVAAPIVHQFKQWLLAKIGAFGQLETFAMARLDRGYYVETRSLLGPQTGFVESDSFARLAERLNLVAYWRTVTWPDHCRPLGERFQCHELQDPDRFEEIVAGAPTLVASE